MSKWIHTDGPWDLIPQDGAGHYIAHRHKVGDEAEPTGLRLIAHLLERKASLAEDLANGRLIAAAPDGLAFVLDYQRTRNRSRSSFVELDQMARAFIARLMP